jgi:hypothetical protein
MGDPVPRAPSAVECSRNHDTAPHTRHCVQAIKGRDIMIPCVTIAVLTSAKSRDSNLKLEIALGTPA